MLSKEKKIRMFLDANGKCEYCDCDMDLVFSNKLLTDSSATFDHKYNRDHELRTVPNNDMERRIYIVCRKCNNEKSKLETNKQEINSVNKTVQKLIPKEYWGREKYIERVSAVVEDERKLNFEMSQIDKQIMRLRHEKTKLTVQLSKKVRYRNLLISFKDEPQNQF